MNSFTRYELAQMTNVELQNILRDRGDQRRVVYGHRDDEENVLSRTEAIDLILNTNTVLQ